MDDYMNQGIRKVIESCPPVGDILDHYSIGCVQCADGSCRMGDISRSSKILSLLKRRRTYPIDSVIPPNLFQGMVRTTLTAGGDRQNPPELVSGDG